MENPNLEIKDELILEEPFEDTLMSQIQVMKIENNCYIDSNTQSENQKNPDMDVNQNLQNSIKTFEDLKIDHAKNKIGDSNNHFRKQHKVFKGVKNYKCNFCGKCFGRKKHLCKGVQKARNDYKIHLKLWNKTGNSD